MWAWIVVILQGIWDAVQAVGDVVVTALVWLYHALKIFAGAIWDAGKFTWNNIVKPVGQFLNRVYEKLKAFYDRVIKPVHAWLMRVSKALRCIYNTYFAPILTAIDALRKALKLLELLHVDWAKKIDDELGRLEQKLSAPIQVAIQFINRIISRIDAFILLPNNLFHRVTLLKSMGRDIAHTFNMSWNHAFHFMPEPTPGFPPGGHGRKPIEEHEQYFEGLLSEEEPDPESVAGKGLALLERLLAN